MALISCPECAKQVSDKAAACPNCGHPILERASAPQAATPPGAHDTGASTREQTSVPKTFAVGDPSWQPFIRFLTASVKDLHPTAPRVSEWLTPGRKVSTAKEIAYQQRRFLDFSKTFLDSQPAVTLLTCVKHRDVEKCYEVSAARFPEVADKRFWDELTVDMQETWAAAEKLLDKETVSEARELCDYQNLADKISAAPAALTELRNLRSQFSNAVNLTWVGPLLIVGGVLLIAGGDEGEHSIAVWGGLAIVAGVITSIYHLRKLIRRGYVNQEDLRKRYLRVFEEKIAPCLKLARVDPAACIDNLDYVEQVINSVSERYRYLQGKLLRPFLSQKAEL